MSSGFALTCFSRLLMGVIARAGITHLVVSPGSRSTPYLCAALQFPTLRLHSIVDERSAAFVALGLARGLGRPVALLCTSGTAAANYLPAIVEARLTGAPLIVLTADRPLALQGCAASQTIDQNRIYGAHVVSSISLSVSNDMAEMVQIRRQIMAAISLALEPEPGPVHLNLHTPKPLEPCEARSAAEVAQLSQLADILAATPPIRRHDSPLMAEETIEELVRTARAEPRGLITCGFDPDFPRLDPDVLSRFARATGYPVLLDAAHPLRFDAIPSLRDQMVAPFEPLLRQSEWRQSAAPRVVVQIGRPLTSSQFEPWTTALAERSLCRILMLARRGWPDPSGHAELVGRGDVNDALLRASVRLEAIPKQPSSWGLRWSEATTMTRRAIATFAQRSNDQATDLGELDFVLALLGALPVRSRLVIGNSLAVRELDLLATNDVLGIRGEALRGASGIDGVLSTSVGYALSDAAPTTLLVGDVSFLHDIGGLWAAQRVRTSLAIVVLNNHGGRIFEQLPIGASRPPQPLEYWTTPHQADLSAAAAVFALKYARVATKAMLLAAIHEAHCEQGATVIEVIVPPSSALHQSQLLMEMSRAELLRSGLLGEPEL